MLKGVLRELLPKYVPFGRGGALGATGIGLVGNILCCSNWAFCKALSSNSYSCNKCSACCRILGKLELPWNGRITASTRAYRGQKSIGILFPCLMVVQHSLWPYAKFLNQNYLHQGTKGYIQPLSEGKPLFAGVKLKNPWTLNKCWSKVEKWGGFPANWPVSWYLPASIGPGGHSVNLVMCTRIPVSGCHLLVL